MTEEYANDFTEIPQTLEANSALRVAVVAVVEREAMPGKATEGSDRLERFRRILIDLVNGRLSLEGAYERTEQELSRDTSPHRDDNRVFAAGWAERLVRTQLSRCYNQAVMEKLLSEGATMCFVPHSSAEDPGTACSLELAGGHHELQPLYERLTRAYRDGVWSREVKIPNHPHCTHTITPSRET